MVYNTFTAANTAKGFFSYFDEFIYSNDVKKVYLIKGGPGCGKSTFMKKVAAEARNKGYTVEQVLCSSDKNSIDGIKIEELKKVIIDATSPHAYDMKYPGAYESIIDFSRFWDEQMLSSNLSSIKSITDIISSKYASIYSVLRVAGGIEHCKTAFIEKCTDNERINESIKKVIKQNAIAKIENIPVVSNRMLSCFSGDGIYTAAETTELLCDEYIILEDVIGAGHIYLSKVAGYFNKIGYDTLRIHCPLLPENMLEQVIIPQLRIGFIAMGHLYSPEIDQSKITKKINTKVFVDKEKYMLHKNKLNLYKRLTKELIQSVCNDIKNIKSMHDKLEEIYINAVDFDKVDSFTKAFINGILN